MKKLITEAMAFLMRLMNGQTSEIETMMFGAAIIVCSAIIICTLNHFLIGGQETRP